MRVLIIGGTSFVGRAIAWSALAANHEVTVINRGQTESDLPDAVTRLVGEREKDLSALAGRDFDLTVDAIAYRPRGVATLYEALGNRGGHHIQISSVSAYEDPAEEGASESVARLHPEPTFDLDAAVTSETYGPLKAACERAAQEYFGDSLSIVRPTYIIGSHDATLRFPYWTQRLARGGDVAVPGPRANAFQYIDARDLGDFVVTLGERSTCGDFHVATPYPAVRFVEALEQIADLIAPPGTTLVEVAYEQIARHHLDGRFPLWSGTTNPTVLAVDPAKALGAGLRCRALRESVEDVVQWWGDREGPSWWLTREQEAMLVQTGPSRGPSRGPGPGR